MSENILRDKMDRYLKAKLRDIARRTRDDKHLTQQKMGDRYVMNGDSFRAIEAGEYMYVSSTEFSGKTFLKKSFSPSNSR